MITCTVFSEAIIGDSKPLVQYTILQLTLISVMYTTASCNKSNYILYIPTPNPYLKTKLAVKVCTYVSQNIQSKMLKA